MIYILSYVHGKKYIYTKHDIWNTHGYSLFKYNLLFIIIKRNIKLDNKQTFQNNGPLKGCQIMVSERDVHPRSDGLRAKSYLHHISIVSQV